MCYAIPGRIISIKDNIATLDFDGIKKTANISLIDAKTNDYVLVHAGFAIEIVDTKKAVDSINFLKNELS